MRVLPFALLALTGCAADASGIWMINEPYAEDSTTCEDSMEENFDRGEPKETDGGTSSGDWTYDEEHIGSDTVYFFQIYLDGNNEAVLVTAKAAFPGVWEADHWTFTWADKSEDLATAEHDEGYGYAEQTTVESTTTYELTMTGADTADVTVSGSTTTTRRYQESDEWDPDDTDPEVGSSGMIPSSDYLEYREDGDDVDQVNISDEEDCTDEYCVLTLTSTCSGSDEVTAERVKTDDQDAFDYLDGTSNGGGT